MPWTTLKWDFVFKKTMHTTKQVSLFDRSSAIAISSFCWWGKCRQTSTVICSNPCRSWFTERVLLTLCPAPHRHSGQPQWVFPSFYTEGVVGCGVESPWLLLHAHVKKHTHLTSSCHDFCSPVILSSLWMPESLMVSYQHTGARSAAAIITCYSLQPLVPTCA